MCELGTLSFTRPLQRGVRRRTVEVDLTRFRVCNACDFAGTKDIDDVGHRRSGANVGRDMVLGVAHVLAPGNVVNAKFTTILKGYTRPHAVPLGTLSFTRPLQRVLDGCLPSR